MRVDPWMTARVVSSVQLASSCLIVRVKPDERLANLVAGQAINISLKEPLDGRRVSAFTVLSVHARGEFSLLIRPTGTGGVSDGLEALGESSETIWVSESIPTVTLPGPLGEKPILCLVAGSGASILGGLSANRSLSDADIVFVGRADDCATIPDALTTYLAEHDSRTTPRTWTNWNSTEKGRPQAVDVAGLVGDESRYAAVVACGREGFCELVRDVCVGMGIDGKRLILESFGAEVVSQSSAPNAPSAPDAPNAPSAPEVTAVVDLFGQTHAVRWPENENLLSAMLNAGLDVPYSCRAGICSTCQCSVLIGDAEMQVDLGLSDEEKTTGLALACQLLPMSNALAVRFASANSDA